MTNREAINLLEEVRVLDDSIYAYNKAYSDALEMALTALEAEEAWYDTHEYPHKEQWIPVSSGKLPENYANVLLQIAEECRYDDIGEVIDYWFVSGCRFNKKWFANEHPDVSKQIDGVVAWMPLPEPFREGGAE